MATTYRKGTHKADSGPKVQHLGSRKGGSVEKKSAIVEKKETHHSDSEHQPTPPKASLEQL